MRVHTLTLVSSGLMLVVLSVLATYILTCRMENKRDVEKQQLQNLTEQYAEKRAKILAEQYVNQRIEELLNQGDDDDDVDDSYGSTGLVSEEEGSLMTDLAKSY